MKLFLLICFAAAFAIIATISVIGAERMPDWLLPAAVFGVPAIAITLVLVIGTIRRRQDQEIRESKAGLNVERNSSNDH